MSVRVLALVAAATLCACSGPAQIGRPPAGPVDSQTAEAPAEAHFACSLYWRQSDAHDHTQTENVALRSGTQQFTLHGFELTLTADWDDKPSLQLEANMGDSVLRSEHVFEGKPERMTEAGHGFTGLQYLTDDTGAELQYWCGAAGAGFEAEADPMSAEGDAGDIGLAPGDLPTASVSCEASATTVDGEHLGPKTFTVEPGSEYKLPGLGPFALDVHYLASRYEGSVVLIDAGDAAAKRSRPTVHTLYQLGASGPPEGTMAGPSFTGMQSLEHGGQTLRYRCWTDA